MMVLVKSHNYEQAIEIFDQNKVQTPDINYMISLKILSLAKLKEWSKLKKFVEDMMKQKKITTRFNFIYI